MIAIVNVDPDLRETGPHVYEVRINRTVVAKFSHRREDDLSTLLERAALAVAANKKEMIRINREVVATFVHNREDDLFAMFERAALAVAANKKEMK